MAPPPKLSPEQWAALRAEYEAGAASTRALAEKFGVSEAAIRKRAADTTQPGGSWQRESLGPTIEEAARRAARRAAAKQLKAAETDGAQDDGARDDGARGDGAHDGAREPSKPAEILPPARLKPSYDNPTTREMADPAFRAALREEIIDSVAELLAQENSQHIESRVGPLKTMFARLLTLLNLAMTTPDPNDQEAVDRRRAAQAALIVGRGDSVSGHLQALIKLSESIQAQMRRALGVEDRMKKVGLEVSGPGGAPIQSQHAVGVLDMTRLTTAEMEQLYQAALIMEGGRERPPIPSPPGDPPALPGGGGA